MPIYMVPYYNVINMHASITIVNRIRGTFVCRMNRGRVYNNNHYFIALKSGSIPGIHQIQWVACHDLHTTYIDPIKSTMYVIRYLLLHCRINIDVHRMQSVWKNWAFSIIHFGGHKNTGCVVSCKWWDFTVCQIMTAGLESWKKEMAS